MELHRYVGDIRICSCRNFSIFLSLLGTFGMCFVIWTTYEYVILGIVAVDPIGGSTLELVPNIECFVVFVVIGNISGTRPIIWATCEYGIIEIIVV